MTHEVTEMLSEHEWQTKASTHYEEVIQWTQPHRSRRGSHTKHPVYDFLFTYYPFSLGKLEQWHPGYRSALEIITADTPTVYQTKYYTRLDNLVFLNADALKEKEIKRIRWIHNLLKLTQSRPANFSCFGMHEWAMVYQTGKAGVDLRHRESAPLRFSQEETDRIVESRPIRCSHFDAFRFFTPPAIKFNKLQPTLDKRDEFEQSGCLHTNMDLYKWASKCMPWVGSHLLWKCFRLALQTRELDMRASPYDLSEYGYQPVKIETQEGRVEYEILQRKITQKAQILREKIIEILNVVINSSPSTPLTEKTKN